MSLKAMCRVPGGAFRIRALQLLEAETVFGYVHGVGATTSLSPWQPVGFNLAYFEAAAELLHNHWPGAAALTKMMSATLSPDSSVGGDRRSDNG
jgi:hypothetical protein